MTLVETEQISGGLWSGFGGVWLFGFSVDCKVPGGCSFICLPILVLGSSWFLSTRKGHVEGQGKEKEGESRAILINSHGNDIERDMLGCQPLYHRVGSVPCSTLGTPPCPQATTFQLVLGIINSLEGMVDSGTSLGAPITRPGDSPASASPPVELKFGGGQGGDAQ